MGDVISHSEKIARADSAHISTSFHLFKDFLPCSKGQNASADVTNDYLPLSIFFSYSLLNQCGPFYFFLEYVFSFVRD